jgi:hypothetical protein
MFANKPHYSFNFQLNHTFGKAFANSPRISLANARAKARLAALNCIRV